jgi:septum formation protein
MLCYGLMLVLASASPRRQELLRNARIVFKVIPADVPEVPHEGEPPREFAERLAREKARAIFHQLATADRAPESNFVLGADTVVIVDGAILGKPSDERDAARMLRLLSGRSHQVITAVCLIGNEHQPSGKTKPLKGKNRVGRRRTVFEDVRSESTNVYFNPLSQAEIADYVSSGEPMDKAGAYGIQGMASRWIPRVEGCYFNVVGLPVPLVCRMLREHRVL